MPRQLEYIVRPVQFPLIRPAARPAKPTEAEERITEINGGDVSELQLNANISTNMSWSGGTQKVMTMKTSEVRVSPSDEDADSGTYIDMLVTDEYQYFQDGMPTKVELAKGSQLPASIQDKNVKYLGQRCYKRQRRKNGSVGPWVETACASMLGEAG